MCSKEGLQSFVANSTWVGGFITLLCPLRPFKYVVITPTCHKRSLYLCGEWCGALCGQSASQSVSQSVDPQFPQLFRHVNREGHIKWSFNPACVKLPKQSDSIGFDPENGGTLDSGFALYCHEYCIILAPKWIYIYLLFQCKVSPANLLEGFGVSAVIVSQLSIRHIVYFNEI